MEAPPARVPIRFGRLTWLLLLSGLSPARSYLEIGADTMLVRMSWAFSARVERSSIRRSARAPDSPFSIGVHGWAGRWIVNGAAGPMVSIEIAPAARARVLGFPVRLSELLVSVDDPDGLVAALSLR